MSYEDKIINMPTVVGIRAAIKLVDDCARQTGRTTRLLESLVPDDVFVVRTQAYAGQIRSKLRDMGKKNQVFSCATHTSVMNLLHENRPHITGKIVLDHDVEMMMVNHHLDDMETWMGRIMARPAGSRDTAEKVWRG